MMSTVSKANFINRELSWLEFNYRVLEEALDRTNPLLERLKFTAIVSSNLDEFFMVRVASLADQILAGFNRTDPAGLTPEEQLQKIGIRVNEIVQAQYQCYNTDLVSGLEQEKIYFIKTGNLSLAQRQYLDDYYWKTIYPVLTPMVVDQSRPFPLILNKSLNVALLVEQEGSNEPLFATVQVPSVLGRYVEIPGEDDGRYFVLLEEIIKMYIDTIFRGHHILAMGCYRVTRNADLGYDEEGAEDLLEAIEQSLRMRRWSAVIRLEVEEGMNLELLRILQEEMEVQNLETYLLKGPIDLTFLMKVSSIDGYDYLRYVPARPQPIPQFLENNNIFKVIVREDVLLHHPYESFDPVVELVRQATQDPEVLAIKQTLYRVSGDSPIVKALAHAAEKGKQVTVLVELKARFDEENNIAWARRLEKSGCHVIYGLIGLKIHCKALLIVRKEPDGIKRYVHLGTGNYNDVTARIYTDLGLFTSNPYFGADISALFNMLSGYSYLPDLYKIDVAPGGLRDKFISLINQERDNAKRGKKGQIIAKMNALVDEEIIQALYGASQVGVEIDLIVRGICCLRPGVEGLSENIRVRSIVGRYLEHSRIYYFYNDGSESVYLSSADWMPRNLDRRVELLFPIEDADNRELVIEILELSLRDTEKSRILLENGRYIKLKSEGRQKINSQDYFYRLAKRAVEKYAKFEEIHLKSMVID